MNTDKLLNVNRPVYRLEMLKLMAIGGRHRENVHHQPPCYHRPPRDYWHQQLHKVPSDHRHHKPPKVPSDHRHHQRQQHH
ncbi:hypothetical protein NG798_22545 [Ancylothrix sp. C2]|uniref:hypothetical protein n=1 Tax=Ancylothrix sp. D3o TaxID=2953691 RepID=UPI0021BA40E6|nr:hypothetical protein [Ancylothrix sp. D3o]MCT7952580.1 hypothetical protein [Ancylothrix sp. D3o]